MPPASAQQKTEKPTPRRRRKARQEGTVAQSNEVNNAVVLLDATSFGGAIATDDLAAAGVSVVPMVFTPRTKEEVLTALAVDIEQERLKICNHEETMTEMKAFQQITLPGGTTRLSAPPGFQDDCVIALALMNWQFGRPASFSVEDVVGIPGIGFEQSRDPLLN